MGLSRSDRLEATGTPMQGLALTPEDFFVFSRIDGNATVAEIVAASGLAPALAEGILSRLLDLGAVRKKSDAALPPRTRAESNSHLRDAALRRRKQLLRAQLEGGAPVPAPAPVPEPPPPAPEESLPATRVRLVPPEDPRLDPGLAIPVEHQRLVLAINDQLQHLTHFDLLGIAPTTDKKEIRRAYHQISRKFHPDAYYGRDLGKYRALLDQLFKRARSSYELLTDDPRREAYVERLLAEREQETAQLRKRRETEAAAKEAVERAEHEHRLLLEQREKKREEERQAAERQAREERDRERRMRQGRRLSPLEGRQNKARDHYERAKQELAAKRPGAAASLFRLAMDLDPGNTEYHEQWQRSLAQARVERADKAFETAKRYEETGRAAEAAHYYLDAAESNPTPRFLAHAALAVRNEEPARARELALRALDGLSAAGKLGDPLPAREQGSVHAMCGYAFLAAGQLNTAREQADAARILLGDTENIRALLAAIKNAKA